MVKLHIQQKIHENSVLNISLILFPKIRNFIIYIKSNKVY